MEISQRFLTKAVLPIEGFGLFLRYKIRIMRKNRLHTLLLAVAATFSLLSCGEDRTHEYIEMTADNQWIYSQMKEKYLWADGIKSPDRSQFFTTPSKFFGSLLNGSDEASFFTDSASLTSYGMRCTIMRDPLGEQRSRYYALVLFVEPGSPADIAGITRGTWIAAIGGKSITTSSGGTLMSGNATTAVTRNIMFDDVDERYAWSDTDTLSIQQAGCLDTQAICLDSTYNVRDSRIGYIICNTLDGENTVQQFNDIMLSFACENVTDVVLDMRYCSGGTIENAAAIASMLVPAQLEGTPFATLIDKDSIGTAVNYSMQNVNLSEKRLYIITGNATKGIAELFIASVNASRGMHEVVTFGAGTAGANVMTEAMESAYGFTINPAVAFMHASDGRMFGTSGIAPDYPLDDTEEPEHIYPLGREQEYILRNIGYFITNGHLPTN